MLNNNRLMKKLGNFKINPAFPYNPMAANVPLLPRLTQPDSKTPYMSSGGPTPFESFYA